MVKQLALREARVIVFRIGQDEIDDDDQFCIHGFAEHVQYDVSWFSNILRIKDDLFDFCNTSFEGRVVAKLPFEPISFLRGISHRSLIGEDYTDCSFLFLYILCTMSFRQVNCLFASVRPSGVPCIEAREAAAISILKLKKKFELPHFYQTIF
jgi:hypothetical protein